MAKKPKTRRGSVPVSDLWSDDQLVEAPAKNSAAYQLSERWTRSIRTYTKVAVWSSPVIALLLLVIYSESGQQVVPDKVVVTNQVDSAGKSAAIIAENAWMDSDPSPLNGGEIVAWNGFDVKKPAKIVVALEEVTIAPAYAIEVHYFTLTDAQGFDYASEISIGVSKTDGARPLSTPSLTPIPPAAGGWETSGAWYGLQSAEASKAVTATVEAWSQAFTSGDPTALGQNVQDPKANHAYMPLTGVSAVESTVISAGSIPVLTADGQPSEVAPKTIVVQIQLKLTWAGVAPSTTGSGNSVITYDLLVEKADTASPVVVAWGGSGSGTSLKPYGNAVVDRSLEVAGSEEGTK